MIENPKFAVRIFILMVVIPDIKVFPLLAAMLLFPVFIVVGLSGACKQNSFFELLWLKTIDLHRLMLEFRCSLSYFRFGGYCHFRLSFVVEIAGDSFFELALCNRTRQICRRTFDPVCHCSEDISIPGFGGHIHCTSVPNLSRNGDFF